MQSVLGKGLAPLRIFHSESWNSWVSLDRVGSSRSLDPRLLACSGFVLQGQKHCDH